MAFKQNMALLMEACGYSNYRMAKIIGCSQSTVKNILSGDTTPQGRTKAAIMDHFGVTEEEMDGDTCPSIDVEKIKAKTEKAPTPEDERNDELSEYLEMLRNRPECRMLFSLAKGATKEDVETAVTIIEAIRKKEGR